MMWRNIYFVVILCVISVILAAPQSPFSFPRSKRPIPVFRDDKNQTGGLRLPNNATSIRENIVDTFSCEDRIYGYYADIDNECQVFHVCLPQHRGSIRYSFICPAETVFNQETFVCTRTADAVQCEESEKYYSLNEEFGKEDKKQDDQTTYPPDLEGGNNEVPITSYPGYSRGTRGRGERRGKSRSNDDTYEYSEDNNNYPASQNSTNARISRRH